MSGVYARDRRPTRLDALDFASDLQDELSKFVANEKYVPKKHRFTSGASAIQKCDELIDCLILVEHSPKSSEKHKDAIYRAIVYCIQLDRRLSRLINTVKTAAGGEMPRILDLLVETEEATRRLVQ